MGDLTAELKALVRDAYCEGFSAAKAAMERIIADNGRTNT